MKKNISEYKIDVFTNGDYSPARNAVTFGLIDKVDGKRLLMTGLNYCREGICATVHRYVMEKFDKIPEYQKNNNKNFSIDLERLRLLTALNSSDQERLETFRKNVFFAKHLLNVLEKTMGWSKPSVVSTAKFMHKDKVICPCWLITGPKEWLSYPQFFTFMMYVMRIGISVGPIEGHTEINKIREIQDYIKAIDPNKHGLEFLTDYRVKGDRNSSKRAEADKALELFKHGTRIFEPVPIEEAWDYPEEAKTRYDNINFGHMAGIHNFVQGNYNKLNPAVEAAHERFKELV